MPSMPAPRDGSDWSSSCAPEYEHPSGMEECSHPRVRYAQGASEVKGEDVLLAAHQRPWPGTAGAAEVARGGGRAAALLLRGDGSGLAGADLDSAHMRSAGGSTAGDDDDASEEGSSHGASARDGFAPGCCAACGQPDDCYSLFAVFDGHNGSAAAKLCAAHAVELVESGLPPGSPPGEVRRAAGGGRRRGGRRISPTVGHPSIQAGPTSLDAPLLTPAPNPPTNNANVRAG